MRQVKSFVKLGFLAFASLVIGVTSCTKDSADSKEPVDASKTEIPAAPGDNGMVDSAFQPETVYFAFDQSTVESSYMANLDQFGAFLQKNAEVKVEIAGHADERGTEQYNLALGQRRADAVKNYLVKLGVDDSRVNTVSYGKLRPVDPAHNSAAWSKNRRAEFVLSH
jgi:peptidoglycan-associated lipoprotein